MFKAFYEVSKPGIIYANVLTCLAGFIFATSWKFDFLVLASLLFGLALIIASACAVNNCLDRSLDRRMKRTSKRALIERRLTLRQVVTYAVLCFGLGLAVLYRQSWLTIGLIVIAYLDYVIFYSFGKRLSVHGTLVGCVSGALPLVAGYVAGHGSLDATAGYLFLLMVVWQMAHFYGIALYRQSDYAAAGLPVMPVIYGVKATKIQVQVYMAGFVAVSGLLMAAGSLNVYAGSVLIASGLWWSIRTWSSFSSSAESWGRQVFLRSLVVILVMSTVLMVDPLIS